MRKRVVVIAGVVVLGGLTAAIVPALAGSPGEVLVPPQTTTSKPEPTSSTTKPAPTTTWTTKPPASSTTKPARPGPISSTTKPAESSYPVDK